MIVVDASAALLALLNDGDARHQLASDELHAPHLVDSEVAHALRSQLLRGRVRVSQASAALDTWRRLGLRRHAAVGLLPRVWALRENVSAYDATYVALAETLACPLLTGDARLASAPRVRCAVVTVRT